MRKPGFIATLACCAFVMMLAFLSGRAGAQGAEFPDLTPIRVLSLKVHVIKITPEGRKTVADSDYPGLPPDEVIVTARLKGPKQTSLPEGRARLYVLHAAHGKPLHRHIFKGLAFDRKGVATLTTSIRKRLCGSLLFRSQHKDSRIDITTNIAC